ncbi:unnamed protein product, partial [Dibothriocephalus latus]
MITLPVDRYMNQRCSITPKVTANLASGSNTNAVGSTIIAHTALERMSNPPVGSGSINRSLDGRTGNFRSLNNDYNCKQYSKKSAPQRFITEIKLNIRNPSTNPYRISTLEQMKQIRESICCGESVFAGDVTNEVEYPAIPGRTALQDASFFPPPPDDFLSLSCRKFPEFSSLPLPKSPIFTDVDTSRSHSGRNESSNVERPYVQHTGRGFEPDYFCYRSSYHPSRCAFDNRGTIPDIFAFRGDGVVPLSELQKTEKPFSPQAVCGTNATASIRELLHGSSLLNLNQLLKHSETLGIDEDDELGSSSTLMSSPTDSLEDPRNDSPAPRNLWMSSGFFDRHYSQPPELSRSRSSRGTQFSATQTEVERVLRDREVQTLKEDAESVCGNPFPNNAGISSTLARINQLCHHASQSLQSKNILDQAGWQQKARQQGEPEQVLKQPLVGMSGACQRGFPNTNAAVQTETSR